MTTATAISKSRLALYTALAVALPMSAYAHPGHALGTDFSGGFAHPYSGIDHVLAMIAVGLWAAQLGGRARIVVPLGFVTLMLLAAALGAAHVGARFLVPSIEAGIAASVLVLGVLVTASVRLPLAASLVLVAVFALFHGYAHGMEMPYSTDGARYALGLALATATLHAIGVAAAVTLARLRGGAVIRLTGAAVAIGGVALLLQ